MSIKAMTWVWSLENLPTKESMVLLALADAANDEGFCWPSQEVVAAKSRMSVRSVKRAIAALKSAGLLEVSPRGLRVESSHGSCAGGRASNLYRVCVGVEFSAESWKRAKLAPKSSQPVDNSHEDPKNEDFSAEYCKRDNLAPNPVDNFQDSTQKPDDSGKGPNWPLRGLGAKSCNPYLIKNPNLNSIPTSLSCVNAREGFSGVVGMDGSGNDSQQVLGAERRASAPAALVELAGPDWELLGRCLPGAMVKLLPVSAARVVCELLASALRDGWSEGEILARLAANPLPERVTNPAGLVIFRVKDALSAPVPRPALREVSDRFTAELAELDAILDGSSTWPVQRQLDALTSLECAQVLPEGDQTPGYAQALHRLALASWDGSGGVRAKAAP